MKPKSIRAALQLMLPEIEEMMSLGVSRAEIYKAVSERFGLEGVNVRSFDTSLYRARQIRKNGMHNTHGRMPNTKIVYCTIHKMEVARKVQRKVYCTIHKRRLSLNRKEVKKESPGIIDKEFFNKISEDFDPKMFNKNSEVIYESSGN